MKSCFIVLLGLSAIALAQRPGWDFRTVVTNAPYSGVGVTTSKRTLSDGNAINESNCAKVYRDSAGRTRREETRNSASCSVTPDAIQISDPVAGVRYAINTQNKTYRQFTIQAPASRTTPEARTRPANPNEVRTSLPASVIAGTSFSAENTQTVTTIPAGKLGNAQPIAITSTRSYSPDLQIVISSTRTDPRSGVTTYQLTNISTAEPAESLFQLPAGLTLEQGPSRRGRRAP
jgi:hypothetical protein